MANNPGITRGQALRYLFLPQIFPRVSKLLGSGFINLPYFIVVVLNTVKIIPDGHPYLRRDHHGRYSIFQALAVGADNIPFNRKNIDKITIFGTILVGLALLIMQFLLCIAAIFTNPAFASNGPGLGPRTAEAFIGNNNAQSDLAFRLLDLVFGIPNIFNSSNQGTTPFHFGLQALFEFYSYGILLVGTFVIIYLTTTIVLETAQSGVPFGQRFNKAWAPVRLILFFGLLLPANNGINLAQYVVLESAKLGSNVATNAWLTFDKAANTPYLGNAAELVAMPNLPDLQSYISFMALSRTCSWAEGRINGYDVRPYIVFPTGDPVDISTSVPAFSTLADRAKGGTLVIRLGVHDKERYKTEQGNVFPQCGELAMPLVDRAQPGSAFIQQAYLETIPCFWTVSSGSALQNCSTDIFSDMGRDFTARYSNAVLPEKNYPNMEPYLWPAQRMSVAMMFNYDLEEAVKEGVKRQREQGDWNNNPALVRGWAGAGIWFNRIAEQNGAITAAIHAKPEPMLLPYVMEYIKKEKLRQDSNTPLTQLFTPMLSSGNMIRFETPQQRDVAVVLSQIFKAWGIEGVVPFYENTPVSYNQGQTGNVIIDVFNAMMGTQGLFDMCRNMNVSPLAQLSSMGRGLIEHSIRNFGMATGAGLLTLLDKSNFKQTLKAATDFLLTFGSIGLLLGFLLFYVLPFLPFIYFFFAIMTWIKSIFEAMVGMPLWALAHLKIDGEGMPGDAAASGYFYILEIFLRPTVIIVSFLGGIIIFTAMVKVLNQIFYLVLTNLTGHISMAGTTDCFGPPGSPGPSESEFKRGSIDEFFYTVIYTIVVYMIALPCFKLVDDIPDNIMRWLGAGISSFGSQDGDPARGLMTNVAGGATLIGGQMSGSVRNMGFTTHSKD
ncbi:MAG TPA: DotA/TraY family protein [Micavibrio sp.]|nr:DotA/TraY family protein [Micavibrio sp.]